MNPRNPLQNKTIIVSLGMLLELNHKTCAEAFIKLSQRNDAMAQHEKLDLNKIQKTMPTILTIDAAFRAGKLTTQQFREQILKALQLNASDKDFDQAWNAMQGDLSKLKQQIEAIKNQFPLQRVIFISKTNPIHIKHIIETLDPNNKMDSTHDRNPLSLLGIPLHVSYQSSAYQNGLSDIDFYNEVSRQHQLDPKQTIILLQCTSNSLFPAVKIRDEAIAKNIKDFAKTQGSYIIDRQPQENIVVAISRFSLATKMINFGNKWHSGKISMWSSPQTDKSDVDNSIRANSVYRP